MMKNIILDFNYIGIIQTCTINENNGEVMKHKTKIEIDI